MTIGSIVKLTVKNPAILNDKLIHRVPTKIMQELFRMDIEQRDNSIKVIYEQ